MTEWDGPPGIKKKGRPKKRKKAVPTRPPIAKTVIKMAYLQAPPEKTDMELIEEVGLSEATFYRFIKKEGLTNRKGELYQQIRDKVEKNLILKASKSPSEAIKAAARQATDVIIDHRAGLKRLWATGMALTDRVEAELAGERDCNTEELDASSDAAKKKRMSLNSMAKAYRDIVGSMAQVVVLERKSWELDAEGSTDPMLMGVRAMKDEDVEIRIHQLLRTTGINFPIGRAGATEIRESTFDIPALP